MATSDENERSKGGIQIVIIPNQTVTWGNRPNHAASLNHATVQSAPGWITLDVTPFLAGLTQITIGIGAADPSKNGKIAGYTSENTDASLRPLIQWTISDLAGKEWIFYTIIGVVAVIAALLLVKFVRSKKKGTLTPSKSTKVPMSESDRVDKLKKTIQVSRTLKIDQMAKILALSEANLYARIVDWAAEFGFKLDQDVVDFSGGQKEEFIAALEKEFQTWETSKEKV